MGAPRVHARDAVHTRAEDEQAGKCSPYPVEVICLVVPLQPNVV